LALDAALGWGDNARTTFGGTAPLKFGRAKTSKIYYVLLQLSTWNVNISGTDEDSDKI